MSATLLDLGSLKPNASVSKEIAWAGFSFCRNFKKYFFVYSMPPPVCANSDSGLDCIFPLNEDDAFTSTTKNCQDMGKIWLCMKSNHLWPRM